MRNFLLQSQDITTEQKTVTSTILCKVYQQIQNLYG